MANGVNCQRNKRQPHSLISCLDSNASSSMILSTFLFASLSLSLPVSIHVADAFSASSSRHRPSHQPAIVQSVVVEIEAPDDEHGGAKKKKFMYMTEEQDRALRKLGDHEAGLMRNNQSFLKPAKVKPPRVGAAGGFGKARTTSSSMSSSSLSSTKPTNLAELAQGYAKILHDEGLVRIDNVLTDELCDALKEYLVDLRARATADIENGVIQNSQDRFADVLLNQNRCDLKIPLGPLPVNHALHHLLTKTVLGTLIAMIYDSYGGSGTEATLYELNCFMSNSGARRQLVHADNVCVEQQEGLQPDEPIVLTTFVALQDTDKTMGPTIFIPGTHNLESHQEFFEFRASSSANQKAIEESPKDRLLRTRKNVVGTLAQGSCVIFDPRVLHCAGANECKDPTNTRALFYFSFKNPRVDYPGCPSTGGYGIAESELTLKQLCDELDALVEGRDNDHRKLDLLACFP